MNKDIPPPSAGCSQLQQIIAGLTEGVILIDPDQTIAWANVKAMELHGAEKLSSSLGQSITSCVEAAQKVEAAETTQAAA